VATRRSQIGHRKHRVTELHAFAVTDDPIRKLASRRPLVPKHRPENLFLRRIVTANHRVHTVHGIDRHFRTLQQCGHTSVVVWMRVSDDDRGERLSERLDARADCSPVRHT
jgi:hypothetical protein